MFNCADLIGISNVIGRLEYVLSKISPIDEKKDRNIRQMLSMLMCYYPTDIIADHKKIEILTVYIVFFETSVLCIFDKVDKCGYLF